MKTLRWLVLELKEASKSGRMFLRVIPDYYREALENGANLVEPYKKFQDLYLSRVCDWLPRSVRMTYPGYGKFGLGADAVVDLVTTLSDSAEKSAMSVSEIMHVVDQFDQAAEILEEKLRDSISTPTDKPDAGTEDGQRKNEERELMESHPERSECAKQILAVHPELADAHTADSPRALFVFRTFEER